MLRSMGNGYFGSTRYGGKADDAVLIYAVFIGQAEGRPMGAAKLAEFAGITRPTVIRKLAAMQKLGRVARDSRGCYTLSVDMLNSGEALHAAVAGIQAIHRAARQLSKMDTPGIDD